MTAKDELGVPEGLIENPSSLISSLRMAGTDVYGSDGKRLGSIHSAMINKQTGQATYVTISFSDRPGISDYVRALRWETLRYDEGRCGYVIVMTTEELEKTPLFRLDQADRPQRLQIGVPL